MKQQKEEEVVITEGERQAFDHPSSLHSATSTGPCMKGLRTVNPIQSAPTHANAVGSRAIVGTPTIQQYSNSYSSKGCTALGGGLGIVSAQQQGTREESSQDGKRTNALGSGSIHGLHCH
jgi:hypothetical protein